MNLSLNPLKSTLSVSIWFNNIHSKIIRYSCTSFILYILLFIMSHPLIHDSILIHQKQLTYTSHKTLPEIMESKFCWLFLCCWCWQSYYIDEKVGMMEILLVTHICTTQLENFIQSSLSTNTHFIYTCPHEGTLYQHKYSIIL